MYVIRSRFFQGYANKGKLVAVDDNYYKLVLSTLNSTYLILLKAIITVDDLIHTWVISNYSHLSSLFKDLHSKG